MAQEEFRDLMAKDGTELARVKTELMGSSLYSEDLAPFSMKSPW